jgi:hypothetical protein
MTKPAQIKTSRPFGFPQNRLLVEDLTAVGYPRPAPLLAASDHVFFEDTTTRPANRSAPFILFSIRLYGIGRSAATRRVPFSAVARIAARNDLAVSFIGAPDREDAMKIFAMITSLLLASCAVVQAQSSGGSSGASGATGASGGASGSTLSNGSTISGTGGSPGSNTSNALNHGTTGNNLGANQTNPGTGSSPASSAAVNTPAANSAVNNLSSTDTGVLKK